MTHRLRKQSTEQLRIIIGGFIGLIPCGGLTWHYIQYMLGLAGLGHDVFYIEDTRLWPVYQPDETKTGDCTASVRHLESAMAAFGLSDRWAYRDEASGECFGLSEKRVQEICSSADILVNISCATCMRDEYLAIPARVLVDTDPMFTQVQYDRQIMFTEGKPSLRELVHAHTHHFTFGENIVASDCKIPVCGTNWLPTRQPICLDQWPIEPHVAGRQTGYTTIMNWTAAPPMEYAGETWGQKDSEFYRISELPNSAPDLTFAMAVGQTTGAAVPVHRMRDSGWQVLDSSKLVPDWRTYRKFIQQSRGEVSVAKAAYVKARTGWFSERSACYLASGRPVITQDTGWSKYLPSGDGLLAFIDEQGCVEAVRRVEKDHCMHVRAARRIAEDCFDARLVLGKMLNELGV